MVNMNVPYSRPDRALLTLRDEVYAVYGQPKRMAEFVTGYKSPDNFTGHNADANGIVHAVDLFTDDFGNIPQPAGRALAEKLRLIGKATNRFSYLIHDMGPVDQEPRIAGQFNNWVWQVYAGSSPHSDHIHVSMCDLYWGDPAPIPAADYDSTAPWGISGSTINLAGATKPAPKEWDEMATPEEIRAIVKEEAGKSVWGYSGSTDPKKPNAITMWRRAVNGSISAAQAAQAAAQIAGLSEAVKQLSAAQGVDYTKIEAAVQKALAEGVVDVNVSVNGKES